MSREGHGFEVVELGPGGSSVCACPAGARPNIRTIAKAPALRTAVERVERGHGSAEERGHLWRGPHGRGIAHARDVGVVSREHRVNLAHVLQLKAGGWPIGRSGGRARKCALEVWPVH